MVPTIARGADRSTAVDALVDLAGDRRGLAGVLGDLGRVGRPASHQLTRLEVAFTWDHADRRDRRWWPQGVTGSWDAEPLGSPAGDGDVLLTTAYAKPVRDVRLGSRITVHDVSDVHRVGYEHVLLVDARLDDAGRLSLAPVHAHAGGAAWVGHHLHVAATAKGFHTFDVRDVVAVDALPDLGLPDHGHRYLLPARTTYHSRTPKDEEPLRFSFLSVTSEDPDSQGGRRLLVGEYGRGSTTTRLWSYGLDSGTGLLSVDDSGEAHPSFLATRGVERMQGAVLVDGGLHVVTSRGRFRRGSIWSERRGELVQHEHVLPPGPEDLSHRPAADQLWSVTEYPFTRMVVAVDRGRFG